MALENNNDIARGCSCNMTHPQMMRSKQQTFNKSETIKVSRLLFSCHAFGQQATDCAACWCVSDFHWTVSQHCIGYYLQTFHFLFAFTGKSLEIGDGNKCRVSVPSSSWASNRVSHLDYGLLGAQKLAVIGQDRWIGLHPAGLPQGKLLWRQIRTKKTDTCLKGLRPSALELSRWFMGV